MWRRRVCGKNKGCHQRHSNSAGVALKLAQDGANVSPPQNGLFVLDQLIVSIVPDCVVLDIRLEPEQSSFFSEITIKQLPHLPKGLVRAGKPCVIFNGQPGSHRCLKWATLASNAVAPLVPLTADNYEQHSLQHQMSAAPCSSLRLS